MEQKIVEIVALLEQGKKVKNIIMDNYDELICYFENLLVKNFNCLEKQSITIVNDKLIKIIFGKIKNEEYLNASEVNILLYTIYFESLNFLGLNHNDIKMQFIYPDEERLKSSCYGVHRGKTNEGYKSDIYYNKNMIDKFCKNTDFYERFWIMLTMPHELVHAKQVKDVVDEKINLNSYIISLEEVAIRSGNYYNNNYGFTRLEIDANLRGMDVLTNFICKYKSLNSSVLLELKQAIIDCSYDLYKSCVKHEINYRGLNVKSGAFLLLTCTDFLSSNKKLLEKYPLLMLSHDESGALRGYDELLNDKINIDEWLVVSDGDDIEKIKKEIEKIYDYLFECYDYGNIPLDTMHFGVRHIRRPSNVC